MSYKQLTNTSSMGKYNFFIMGMFDEISDAILIPFLIHCPQRWRDSGMLHTAKVFVEILHSVVHWNIVREIKRVMSRVGEAYGCKIGWISDLTYFVADLRFNAVNITRNAQHISLKKGGRPFGESVSHLFNIVNNLLTFFLQFSLYSAIAVAALLFSI